MPSRFAFPLDNLSRPKYIFSLAQDNLRQREKYAANLLAFMSISIYYHARRSKPLTKSETHLVKIIVQTFSQDDAIKKYLATGEGLNWETFCLYDQPTAPDFVLEGATRLPDNTKDALLKGAHFWCIVLTFIRLATSDAEWTVTIEDSPIKWDETRRQYDAYA